uniref:hypothetical protein n=1 Tax=Bacteroides acidifaciens TaxID=85831 RepID=UPI0025A51B5C
ESELKVTKLNDPTSQDYYGVKIKLFSGVKRTLLPGVNQPRLFHRVFLFRMWAKFCNFVRAVICYNAAKFAISCDMTKQNRNKNATTSN